MRDKDALSVGLGRDATFSEQQDFADQEAKEAKEEDGIDTAIENVLNEAYGKGTQQLGHRTDGHQCVTNRDREEAASLGASLLYGEVLPAGVSRLLDAAHLNAAAGQVMYDFGMGTGKLALQAFLQIPSLRRVVGIELAQSRFSLGEEALMTVVNRYPGEFTIAHWTKNECIRIASTRQRRTLEFRRGNMLSLTDEELTSIDVAVMETDVPQDIHASLSAMLCKLRAKARILTYLNLCKVWLGPIFPFEQLPINRGPEDRFLTSWSSKRGHHFYLWTKTSPPFDWHEACATVLETRQSNKAVRRVTTFFAGFRYGFGRSGRQRRKAAKEVRRRAELERRSAAATARALAIQRAARKSPPATTGHGGAVQRQHVALSIPHTSILHMQGAPGGKAAEPNRQLGRLSKAAKSRKHQREAQAGQVVQGTYYADATLARVSSKSPPGSRSHQDHDPTLRPRTRDSEFTAEDRAQGNAELRHSAASAVR